MDQIVDFNFLIFIKETYPVAFISVVLVEFGYTMASVGFRHHIKSLNEVIIKTLQQILERLH